MKLNAPHSTVNRIAFVGNYLPRQCGIATFTTDLCEAVASAFGVPTAGVRIFECPVSGLRFRRAPASLPYWRVLWVYVPALFWQDAGTTAVGGRGLRPVEP